MLAGEYNNRFSLRFKNKIKDKDEDEDEHEEEIKNNHNEITVAYLNHAKIIHINNFTKDKTVSRVSLFDTNGQSISKWEIKNQDQKNIQLQVKKINSGIYIVTVTTSDSEIRKKIIIP